MCLKQFFLAILVLISPQLYASSLLKLSNQQLTINHCNLVTTNNVLDLALANDGYFVISQGKKNSELLFTRFGMLMLDEDYYIRTNTGDYLLGINKASDPNKLGKLKISMSNLPPKATSKVNMIINLSATADNSEDFTTSATIYDAISGTHILTVDYRKLNLNTWSAQVSVDNIKLYKGTLSFGSTGKLSKQEGLSHIQWPTDYGLNELKIDFSGSTSYASPFILQALAHNGYPLGTLTGLWIDMDGDIFLLYNNGQAKKVQYRIAVAKFTNPTHLEHVGEHLYRPTEKSGQQRLHRMNSLNAVLSGVLEQESCLKN